MTVFILAIGTLVLYIAAIRVRTAADMQARLIDLARLFYREAQEANQHGAETVLKIHNLMIETAALAPGIAGGVIVPADDTTISAHDRQELGEFLSRNAWMFPYLMSMSFIVARLLFHGSPFNPGYALRALAANVAMALCVDRSGRTKLFLDVKRTKREVERVARMDPMGNDGFARAA